MRTTYIILFLLFSLELAAQYSNQYQYNTECNYWSAETFIEPSGDITPDIYTWSFVQTPVTAQLTEIFFIDLTKGWASHTGTGCMRTTNGGLNWDSTSFHDSIFTTTYNGIYFVNQNT